MSEWAATAKLRALGRWLQEPPLFLAAIGITGAVLGKHGVPQWRLWWVGVMVWVLCGALVRATSERVIEQVRMEAKKTRERLP